ncbi:nose resistant to fluoxetine protein 6-like [Cloeon dipterum]|uniref:nose resistant to fluoxetine protein 6-like n=1 Tax=Cloeon dipterum TaxID=197152 RepID=UPI00321FC77B
MEEDGLRLILWILLSLVALGESSQNFSIPKFELPKYVSTHSNSKLLGDIFSMQPPFAPWDSKDEQCRKDSLRFYEGVKNLEMWALKMHDATGKLASGLLNGNLNQLGDFEQCLSVTKGQYCLARAYLEPLASTADDDNVLDLMHSHKMVQSTAFDGVRFFPSFSAISWAFCVPSSCSHREVQSSLRRLARRYNATTEGLRLHVQVDSDGCVVRNKEGIIRKGPLITMSIVLLVVAFAIFGTLADAKLKRDRLEGKISDGQLPPAKQRFLLAFSLSRNTGDLMKTDTAFDDINCLHGIRAVFSLIIYLIHRGVFGLFIPFTNRTELAEDFEGAWTMIFRAFLNNVDTFVVLSGLLTSYYTIKKLQSGKKISVLMMYLTRYVKFTPIFVITVMLVKDMDYWIQSPQVIRVAQHFVNGCKNGFWKSFIYMNNFDGMDHMCYPPSHQLVTDMQMYLAAPFIILAMYKHPRLTTAALTGVLAVLGVLRYVVIHKWHLSTFIYHGISLSQMVDAADRMYLNPLHRMTPYLAGIMLGYFLRVTGRRSLLRKDQMYAGWAVALICGYYSFFGPSEIAERGYKYQPHDSAVFGVLQPVLWSICLCWCIYACYTGYGGMLNSFLSWKGFVVFSKLSYAFYMVQILLIFGGIASIRTPQYYKMNSVFDLNELFLLVVCSVALTLLFLLPLAHVLALATGADLREAEERLASSRRFQARSYSYSVVESRHLRNLEGVKHPPSNLRFREGFLGFLADHDTRKI